MHNLFFEQTYIFSGTFCFVWPFMYFCTLRMQLTKLCPDYEEARLGLGSSQMNTFLHFMLLIILVIVPLIDNF